MRNTCSWIIRSLVVSVSISTAARAADIGENAPSLKGVKQWINGDAVEPASGDGKTIYVVEFWATWCGPCRVTIPHLNKLQEQLKDRNVVIVGVTTEDENTVRPFVNELKMGYLVALDTDKTTEQTWMKDVEGILHDALPISKTSSARTAASFGPGIRWTASTPCSTTFWKVASIPKSSRRGATTKHS